MSEELEFNLEKWLSDNWSEMEARFQKEWNEQGLHCLAAHKQGLREGFKKAVEIIKKQAQAEFWGLQIDAYCFEHIERIAQGLLEKPVTNKFSPEYLAEFKKAQAELPNIEKYFGEEKE